MRYMLHLQGYFVVFSEPEPNENELCYTVECYTKKSFLIKSPCLLSQFPGFSRQIITDFTRYTVVRYKTLQFQT
jgi:hypothetical protein